MTTSPAATSAMAEGRRADSARRRQRVIKALNDAIRNGEEISVSGDRTFLYRHRDLLNNPTPPRPTRRPARPADRP